MKLITPILLVGLCITQKHSCELEKNVKGTFDKSKEFLETSDIVPSTSLREILLSAAKLDEKIFLAELTFNCSGVYHDVVNGPYLSIEIVDISWLKVGAP